MNTSTMFLPNILFHALHLGIIYYEVESAVAYVKTNGSHIVTVHHASIIKTIIYYVITPWLNVFE